MHVECASGTGAQGLGTDPATAPKDPSVLHQQKSETAMVTSPPDESLGRGAPPWSSAGPHPPLRSTGTTWPCVTFPTSVVGPFQTSLSWERFYVERAGAGVGGTPRGRSSTHELLDNCPALTQYKNFSGHLVTANRLPTSRSLFEHPLLNPQRSGWTTNPPIHARRIASSKGTHVRTPGSTNRHTPLACGAHPPPPRQHHHVLHLRCPSPGQT